MNVELVPVDSLRYDPENARQHPKRNLDAIKGSLTNFGQLKPLIVQKDGTVLAGNGTLAAARALGWTEVKVYRVDLTPEQAKAFSLADNRTSDLAEWDEGNLAKVLAELQGSAFDLNSIGFNADDLEKFLPKGTAGPGGNGDPDAIPDAPEQRVKPGQLWILGKHRLLCGDSTKTEDMRRLMDSELADIIFTDPPWNVNYGAEMNHPSWKKRTIQNDNLGTDDWQHFLKSLCANLINFSKPGAPLYCVMGAQEWPEIDFHLREVGFHWSSTIIWAKDRMVLSRKDYHTQYEPIWYGWNGKAARLRELEDRTQTDLWHCDRPAKSDLHPTTKPVELVERALINSSKVGNLVLETFGGSGSTLIAAHKSGRRCFVNELDPQYASVILTRWEEYSGERAVLHSEA